jgi:hypothetical protein
MISAPMSRAPMISAPVSRAPMISAPMSRALMSRALPPIDTPLSTLCAF